MADTKNTPSTNNGGQAPNSAVPAGTSGAINPLTVLGAAVIAVVVAAIAVLLLVNNDRAPDAKTPGATATVNSVPDVEPNFTITKPETVDAAASAWHEAVAPKIGKAIRVLTQPAARNTSLLKARCQQLQSPVAELLAAPAAPRKDIAESFTVWVSSLDAVVNECLTGTPQMPDDVLLSAVTAGLDGSGVHWDLFQQTLGMYVDLTIPK